MSEAAVAEQEVATPATPETSPPEAAVEAPSTGAEEKPDAGAQAAQATEPTGTDEGSDSFDFDAKLKEAMGGDLPASPPAERPGLSLEEVQANLRQQQAQRHSQLRSGADNGIVSALQRQLLLSEEDAKTAWENIIRPHFNAAITDADSYQEALDGYVVDQLPEGQKKAFRERVYRNRKEWVEGLIDLGRQSTEDKWQADLKAGKYLPKDIAKRLADDAFKTGRGTGERTGAVKSGNEVNGATTGGRVDISTKTAARNAHANNKISNAEMRRINADPTIPED